MGKLAQIVRRFGPRYLKRRGGRVPAHQAKALRAIESCRTRRLGGIRRTCQHCGHTHVRWHSCRNRHCPRCQGARQQEWVAARLKELPAVPYAHLVFTIPAELAEHCRADPENLYRALFEAASKTALQLIESRYKAKPGCIAVLHTWGQNLHYHPHIHLLITAGGLTSSDEWKPMPEGYTLPVNALSKIYRAKCFAALKRLGQDLPQKRLPKEWVVHTRAPQLDPGSILLYLSRYVYRVAIDESRIQSVDSDTVTFHYKDYRDNDKRKAMTLKGEEFLRRFLQHVLPDGFVKIRHYGIFAHAVKKDALCRLNQSLRKLGQAWARANAAIQSLLAKLRHKPKIPTCPRCQSQDLVAIEVMPIREAPSIWPQAP